MPPKLGLLGTLSTIALGISVMAGNVQAQTAGNGELLPDLNACEAVENATTTDELQSIIDELLLVNPNDSCIVEAAAKQALLTQTAAPGQQALN